MPVATLSLLVLLSEERHRQPRAVYQYWARAVLAGRTRTQWLVSLCGPSYLAVTGSLFWLVRQWILVTSVYSGFCGRLLKMFRFQRYAWLTLDFGDDFVELLVLSTMLGSTVALGDDFLELFVFSAMLGLTVAPGDNFVKMFVFCALLGSTLDLWCCQSTWPFHRCSSWTRFSCPCPAALHSGGAAGAAHHQGHLHLVAAQILIPMALTVQETIEISRLQFLDKELTCPLLGHTARQMP